MTQKQKKQRPMTREEAKQIALKMCQDGIEKYGEDAVYLRAPCIGKCSWTS